VDDGYGMKCNFGVNEIYAQVFLTKVA